MKRVQVETEFGGRSLVIETGRMARQAHGAAVVHYGDTVVLAAVARQEMTKDMGFFPLTIDYREKTSAAGKFPGGFFKREGRPTTKEILTMRLIDRPTRPLFPKSFKLQEVQVQAMVLSADPEIDPDLAAMNAASAALTLSDIPYLGPIGSVRIGKIDGKLVVDPTISDMARSDLDLVVSGTHDAITMVEAGAREIPEEIILDALELAHERIRVLVALQQDLAKKVTVEKMTLPEKSATLEDLTGRATAKYYRDLRTRIQIPTKRERRQGLKELHDAYKVEYGPDPATGTEKYPPAEVAEAWSNLERKVLRDIVLQDRRRIDGRGMADIRNISCDANVLPRTHGSALFTRGDTQALVTITLGTTRDEQKIDGLREAYNKRFMLHYNFPSFSVGEVRPIRGPGRREIGHGMLAERALEAVLPDPYAFPYTIRIVSDILESNGSSSMASVCGGSLAMMDAGVPLKAPVAGIAMGLVKEADEVRVLSDILGDEDHCGDMDFKVAGTAKGVTSMQLDCKIAGVDRKILGQALEQARQGRLTILGEMAKCLTRARSDISIFALQAHKMKINPAKIGMVVGSGGRTIKEIQATTGAQIEIEDTGEVSIYCQDKEGLQAATKRIEQITEEPEIGEVYEGPVVMIKPFGAIVEFLPGQEGLCHVSELAEGYVANVRDVVREGDRIKVKVLAVDGDRVRLSKRAAETGGEGKPRAPRARAGV